MDLDALAAQFGGSVDDYSIGGERVFLTSDSSKGMSYGEAAQKAIELGGEYSGMVFPEDIHNTTKRSVQAMQGTGLIGVAKDTLPKSGTTPGFAVAMVEIVTADAVVRVHGSADAVMLATIFQSLRA